MRRRPQGTADFTPERPLDGYYNDLRPVLGHDPQPDRARRALAGATRTRISANPVSVAQLGLAALAAGDDSRWLDVARAAADWLVAETDDGGRIPYLFPMPHTYLLDPPWASAMAQGQAASLLLRVAARTGDRAYAAAAGRAIEPLLGASELVATTDAGPVLQEYPTDPPAHVLNGWIFALWGLNDVAAADGLADAGTRAGAGHAFAQGVGALAVRLSEYRTWPSWSRYDLYPHPLTHVASPFYHRLHVAQLVALNRLAPHPELARTARDWQTGASSPVAEVVAVARKVAFRLTRPRRRPARG